jgi:hypothetical protein
MRPVVLIAAFGATAAAGLTLGYMVGRHPDRLRRWARALAGGVQRTELAFAEARENLADMWEEVRAEARHAVEDEAMAQAAAAGRSASTASTPAARKTRSTRRTAGTKVTAARPRKRPASKQRAPAGARPEAPPPPEMAR